MGIFAIIFLVSFVVLALKRLDWSLLLIIALLPSYLIRFQILSIPVTLLEIMILLALAAWLYKDFSHLKKRLVGKEKKISYPFAKEIILLLLASFLAVAVSNFSLAALGIWKAYFFEPILLFILVVNVFSNKKKDNIYLALALSVISIVALGIYQKITGNLITNSFWAAVETRRVVSFFSYPNAVGLFLAPIMSLFLGYLYYLDKNKWGQKIVFSCLIILSFLTIVFARSEGAIIAFVAAAFVFFFFAGKKKRVIISVLALVLTSVILIFSPLRTTFFEKASLSDLSGQIRLQQWKETTQTIKGKTIIFGNGLSNYQQAIAPYHQEGIFFNYDGMENFDALVWATPELREKYWQPVEVYLYPHNIFLNFWSEIGLLGLLVFMYIMIRAVVLGIKMFKYYSHKDDKKKYLLLGMISALMSIFVHGLVDVPYFKNDLAAFFWLLLALLAITKIEKEIAEKTI